MPIIDHVDVRMPPPVDRVSERYLVSREHGAVSLTVKEVEIHPDGRGPCTPTQWTFRSR